MARQLAAFLPRDGLGFLAEPDPDEAIDSWLRYLADHMCTTVSRLAREIGIELKTNPYHLIRDLSEPDLAAISRGTGVAVDLLRDMTLRRWEHLQLLPSPRMRGTPPGAWKRGSGSRFCPDCLIESDGRWRLAWHLQWTFVCVRHRRLLADRCPRCDAIPRTKTRWSTRGRALGILGCDPPCDLRLTADLAAEGLRDDLGDGHPFIEAQREVDAVLAGSVQLGNTAGTQVPVLIWFRDLSALTRVIATAGPDALRTKNGLLDHELLSDASTVLLEQGRDPAQRLAQAAAHSGIMAAATVDALALLDSHDANELEAAVSWIRPIRRRRMLEVAEGYPLSLALTRALSEGAHTRAAARMARLASVNAEVTELRLPKRSRYVPQLTPDHAPARLPTRLGEIYPHLLRGDLPLTAAAVAMLLHRHSQGAPGTHQMRGAAALLGLTDNQAAIITTRNSLQDAEDGDQLVREIMTLRSTYELSQLDDVSLNYGRRRHTFAEPTLLSVKRTKRLADRLGQRHTPAFRVTVSLYVWELLTHSDSLLSTAGRGQHGALRMRFRRQRQEWDRQPPEPLIELATKLLRRERIGECLRPVVVRTSDGTWVLCDPNEASEDTPSPLGMRGGSRYWTPGQLVLAAPEQLVHFAIFSTNPVANRLDANLVAACRDALGLDASTTRTNRRSLSPARVAVEELIGRSLEEQTWCDKMGVGRRPLAEVLLWHYERWAPLRRTFPAR